MGLFDALPPVSSKKSPRDDEDEGAGEDGAKKPLSAYLHFCAERRASRKTSRNLYGASDPRLTN